MLISAPAAGFYGKGGEVNLFYNILKKEKISEKDIQVIKCGGVDY